MSNTVVSFVIALSVVAGAAPLDATLPLSPQEATAGSKPRIPPPTDDSMWVVLDSVNIGQPDPSFWRGLCLDPNGEDFWIMGGDGVTRVQKRNRATGAVVASFQPVIASPYDITRFGDSLAVAYFNSGQVGIYDTLGNFARLIPTPQGLRGLDWDGSSFWVSQTSPYCLYRISPDGTVFDTLSPTTVPDWMGVIELDRTVPDRLWMSVGVRATTVHYCAVDTVAGTWSILATFTHPYGVSPEPVYVGGLAFDGPDAGGSYLWVTGRSSYYLWRVRVHEPVTGAKEAEGGSQNAEGRLQIVQNPAVGSAALRWSGPLTHSPYPVTLSVHDASGRVVYRRAIDNRHSSFDIPLSPGVYLVRLSGGANETRKLVIE